MPRGSPRATSSCTSSAGASTRPSRPSTRAKVDADAASPASAYLGVLGMPGLTAYVGLLDIAALRDGDVVFVSGAAGAVGSLAGQIAKLEGHTVIGSAGSPEKVAYLRDELGFDAAFDYHDGPVSKLLRAAAPDGIDVYFDNVGGEHLEAALGSLRLRGRDRAVRRDLRATTRPSPRPARATSARADRQAADRCAASSSPTTPTASRPSRRRSAPGSPTAALKFRETIVEGGIEAAPQAFIDLLRGANTGKMLVRLG